MLHDTGDSIKPLYIQASISEYSQAMRVVQPSTKGDFLQLQEAEFTHTPIYTALASLGLTVGPLFVAPSCPQRLNQYRTMGSTNKNFKEAVSPWGTS